MKQPHKLLLVYINPENEKFASDIRFKEFFKKAIVINFSDYKSKGRILQPVI